MYHQINLLIKCWLYATTATILLFLLLFFSDNHPLKGNALFMFQIMMSVVILSVPGILLYALLCLGLAMLGVPSAYQLMIRLLASWIYCWPFIGIASSLLRLQSIGMAAILGVSLGIIWHWQHNRNGFTLTSSTDAA